MMKKYIHLIVILLLPFNYLFSQSKDAAKTKVLILGTFHFAQTGKDDDMMSEKRQKEIAEVINKIVRFKPEKIFVERNPEFEYTNKMGEKYDDYLNGKFELTANEYYQLGFRLGKMLGLKKIYQADHPGMYGIFYGKVKNYADKNGQTEILNADAVGTTKPLYQRSEEATTRKQKTVLEMLRYMNSPEYQKLDHGFYVSVFPRIGDTEPRKSAEEKKDPNSYFIGSELLADWYRRNILIYSKVLNQLDFKENRILIIYGNGHSSTLRHLFESNPVFSVEETNKWLK